MISYSLRKCWEKGAPQWTHFFYKPHSVERALSIQIGPFAVHIRWAMKELIYAYVKCHYKRASWGWREGERVSLFADLTSVPLKRRRLFSSRGNFPSQFRSFCLRRLSGAPSPFVFRRISDNEAILKSDNSKERSETTRLIRWTSFILLNIVTLGISPLFIAPNND